MKGPGHEEQQPLHILYADSDESLQNKFLEYCRDHTKAFVTPVQSAKEVLKKATSEPFDLLILADNLPDKTIPDLLLQLRKKNENLPVILFSACENATGIPAEDLIELCLKKGKQPTRKFRELVNLALEAAERQRALQELSENEHRLTNIINFLPDCQNTCCGPSLHIYHHFKNPGAVRRHTA